LYSGVVRAISDIDWFINSGVYDASVIIMADRNTIMLLNVRANTSSCCLLESSNHEPDSTWIKSKHWAWIFVSVQTIVLLISTYLREAVDDITFISSCPAYEHFLAAKISWAIRNSSHVKLMTTGTWIKIEFTIHFAATVGSGKAITIARSLTWRNTSNSRQKKLNFEFIFKLWKKFWFKIILIWNYARVMMFQIRKWLVIVFWNKCKTEISNHNVCVFSLYFSINFCSRSMISSYYYCLLSLTILWRISSSAYVDDQSKKSARVHLFDF